METMHEWSQLDNFFDSLTSFVAVIDAHPEKRAARDLALKYHGNVWLGFSMDRPAQAEIGNFAKLVHGEPGKVNIDRTMALDSVIHSYTSGKTLLPRNARDIGELLPTRDYNGFYAQLCEMVRVEEDDAYGRTIARWLKTRNPDHWHHADMFEWIATLRRPTLEIPKDVQTMMAGSLIGT